MNSSYRQLLSAFTLVQVLLISFASAHPGAPGHVHDDEWPFDLLPAMGVGILVVAALGIFKAVKRKS